jgi:hypothetical protein
MTYQHPLIAGFDFPGTRVANSEAPKALTKRSGLGEDNGNNTRDTGRSSNNVKFGAWRPHVL